MFQQITDPIAGSLLLSALFAALPLILLFVLLGGFRVKAPKAALASLALSMVLAVVGWNMPVGQVLSATVEGALYGLFPILWILVNALWVYRLTVATPWFEVLGRTIRSITNDHRILAILIAFGFGALLESVAGFGAPVAIAAAMLMAAGMTPLKSAIVALVANTAPVAFGAMATPVIVLGGVTGLPLDDLAAMAGRQGLVSLVVPFLLIYVVDGKRGFKQTWPIALVAGVVFTLGQFVTSNYFALELTDVVAAVLTVAAVLLMLRFWRPSELVGATDDADVRAAEADLLVPAGASRSDGAVRGSARSSAGSSPTAGDAAGADAKTERPSARHILMATAPYLIIVAIFSVAMVPAVKAWLTEVGSLTFQWPGLDVTDAAGNPASAMTFHLDHLKATGTLLFFAGLATMALYKVSPREGWKVYQEGVYLLRWTIVTVSTMLALSYVMNLSGQTSTLGVALAATGGFFAVLSPVIGWIGVALTGSDTSSNALFGQLQVSAANETGLSPVLMAVSNSTAGALGKMVSLQNLAIASAAVGLENGESILFRKLVWWSLGLLALLAGFVFLQSTPILGWMVP